jgi:putative acetyltransferase
MSIQIVNANTKVQLNQVRDLMREFLRWHLYRHQEDKELINEYFNHLDFEAELASLPGKYAAPGGSLLLALIDSEPAGCVALRKIDEQTCEMKRMFVYDRFKGNGAGNALAQAIIEQANKIGYSVMKLDTSFRQIEAQKLYQKFGFLKTEAYYCLPQKLKDWLVFMELKLL